tara:strand:- start:9700 stop:11430 length:1731 start_codon:yes stop_codon:yes gene_type:complete
MANNVQIKITAKNKTKAAFRSVTMGLKGVASAAFSMRTAIGLAAGVAGIGFLVKKSMDATDSLAKTSRAIGISVTELQRLRHAASIGGVEAKALDKAMQKLAINISDVAGGTGEAKEAFERYGISAKNIDGSTRGVTDVLGQAAIALQSMKNETDRASFVYDLFGARGAKVINMLKDGKDAMEAMKQEADDLGLVMSKQLIEGVEDANDSIARLTAYIGNVFHRVVATLAPIIEDVTQKLRNFIQIKIDREGGIAAFAVKIARGFEDLYHQAVRAFSAVSDLFAKFNAWTKSLDVKRLAALNREVDSLTKKGSKLQQVFAEGSPMDFAFVGSLTRAGVGQDLDNVIKKMAEVYDEIDRLEQKMRSPISMIPDASGIQTRRNNSVDTPGSAKRQLTQQNEMTIRAAHGLKRQLFEIHQGKIKDAEEANEKMLRSTYKMYGKARVAGEKSAIDTRSAFERAADSLETTFTRLTDSIENTLTDALMGTQSWGQAMRSILAEVLRDQIKAGIVKPFVSSLFGGVGSAINSAIGGPSSTAVTFNINANDTRGFDQLLHDRRSQIVGMVNQAVNDNGQRAIA